VLLSLFLIVLLNTPATTISPTVNNGDLTIIIEGFESLDGQVCVGLYTSADHFLSEVDVYQYVCEQVDNKKVKAVIKGIPEGYYAFSIFHDANNNGTLDKNLIRIPKEAFTFSNHAKVRFGPPSFEEAQFHFVPSQTNVHHVRVKRLMAD